MIADDKIQEIKNQLISQIESNFPEDKKAQAIQEINSMNKEELISFLKQNKIINEEGEESEANKCVFCAIASKQIPAFRITENNSAVAVLELHPVSKAHALIIPKEHIEKPEDISEETKELAQKVAQKIQNLYHPLRTEIAIRNVLGHEAINIIPVYNNETIDSERQEADKKELEEIRKQLEESFNEKEIPIETKSVEEKEPEKPKEIDSKTIWLNKRIP